MTHPPQPPGPDGPGPGPADPPSHEATQAFPAGGAPPPPPPEHGGPPSPPGPSPAGPDPTLVGPDPWGAAAPGPDPVAPGPAPAAAPWGTGAPGTPPPYGSGGAGAPGGPAGPATPHGGAPRSSSARTPGRIVGRAVVVLVVVGLLVAATAWGFVNRRSAEEWRDRAETAEEDLTRSLDRVEATQTELADAQVRLRELANEKAGEVDQNRILTEIVAQAPDVTAALADCQAETASLANDLIAAFGDPEGANVAGLQDRTDEVNDICNDALAQAEALEDTIDGLG